MKNDALPPCMIYIDEEGHWFHEGAEIIRRDFVQAFYEKMEMDGKNRYIIIWQGKRCYVEVADTAFVVWRVTYREQSGSSPAGFELSLSDDSREDLAPESLHVGKDHVLYCRIKTQAFPARFNRGAYYALAAHMKEKDDIFYLPLNGKDYEIKRAD